MTISRFGSRPTPTSDLLLLPPGQRALLANALLASLDAEPEREVEAAWAKVAEERLAACQRGEETVLDGTAVLAEFRARYRA